MGGCSAAPTKNLGPDDGRFLPGAVLAQRWRIISLLGRQYPFRKGRIAEATTIGVIALSLAVILGKPLAGSAYGHWFELSRGQLISAIAMPLSVMAYRCGFT